MPSPTNGKCHCGAQIVDPTGGYAESYCTPYPPDEGLSFDGCKPGDNDLFGGRCDYYCLCLDKLENKGKGKITCCTPKKSWGLQDRNIIGAPTPAPPEGELPDTTLTFRMLTTRTTTTEPYYGAQKLLGNIEFSTVLPFQVKPEEFLTDVQVSRGVADGIAMKLVVPRPWVTAALSIPSRHIQADYQISIPADTRGNSSAWGLLLAILSSAEDDDGLRRWGDALGIAMTMSTEHNYLVAVHSVPFPTTIRSDAKGSTSKASRAGGSSVLLLAYPHVLRVVLLWVFWTVYCD